MNEHREEFVPHFALFVSNHNRALHRASNQKNKIFKKERKNLVLSKAWREIDGGSVAKARHVEIERILHLLAQLHSLPGHGIVAAKEQEEGKKD